MGARVLAVADAFDAMTSNRPYRNALSSEVAYQEILNCSGTQFDPEVVKAMRSCWESGQIEEILNQNNGHKKN
jgi:HD-GYP domain-containing protein (c-di-GMP phosphodiesterase class II)